MQQQRPVPQNHENERNDDPKTLRPHSHGPQRQIDARQTDRRIPEDLDCVHTLVSIVNDGYMRAKNLPGCTYTAPGN